MTDVGENIARLVWQTLRTCVRGMVLAATAVAGLPLFVAAVVSVLLLPAGLGVGLAPKSLLTVRRYTDVQRRWALEWSGVTIVTPYRSRPAKPTNRLFRVFRRCTWVLGDPATWRDLLWTLVNVPVSAVLGLLPAFLLFAFTWVAVDDYGTVMRGWSNHAPQGGSPRQVWRLSCLRTASDFTSSQCFRIDFLIHFRRHITGVRVDADLIIPVHPVSGGDHHVIDPLPAAAEIDKLPLVQAIQRFRRSIIVGITFTPDRTDRVRLLQPLRIADRGILDTTIRMMDQPADRFMATRPDCHLQRIDRKIRTQVISDLPAQNTAGEQIHHERGINPAGRRIHISDIRHPPPVRRSREEMPVQQVIRHGGRVARHRGPRPLTA